MKRNNTRKENTRKFSLGERDLPEEPVIVCHGEEEGLVNTDQASVIINPNWPKTSEYRYLAYVRTCLSFNNGGISIALSRDGIKWKWSSNQALEENEGNSPERVLNNDFINAMRLNAPHALYYSGKYYLWYHTFFNNQNTLRISLATSENGFEFNHDGTTENYTVLDVSNTGFDSATVEAPSVLYNPKDNKFNMWYVGQEKTEDGKRFRLGYAESTDLTGTEWIKNPDGYIFDAASDEWSQGRFGFPRVIKTTSGYLMFYSGQLLTDKDFDIWRIGIASSEDGKSWIPFEGNPVFEGSRDWNNSGVYRPSIISRTPTGQLPAYTMLYSGWNESISQTGIISIASFPENVRAYLHSLNK